MPFVKKTQSQVAGPSSASGSPLFVGRTGEVLFFIHNILKPEAPTHNILSISGQGGVGKSTLLARFIEETHQTPFENYCLTALVDERQATPVGMMEKFAQQLQIAGEFEKTLRRYKEALRKQQVERETLHDTLLERSPDVAGAVVEGIPVAGPLLREGAKVAAMHLLKTYQASQIQQDTELLETPVDDLTRAFVTELNHLADAKVTLGSTREKRQWHIVLFFDTFEQLADEAAPWLLNHFLAAQVSSNVVLVIAGRDPIEHTSPDDPKRWLPYCDDGIIYWISLNSFTEDETRAYLVKRGITNAGQIASIWQLSQGLPLYLGLLTSNPRGDIDPTKGVVVNFLRWIPEQEHIKRQLALDAALLSRPFNQDDLEVFSYGPESDRSLLYQWLTEQPFVRSRSQDGRHLYHDMARDLFSRHLYQRSQKRYYAIRRDLAAYYQELLEKIQDERGKEVYRSEEWLELLLAVVYQLLLLPDQASHIKAIEHILYAFHGNTSAEQDKEIARLLQATSQNLSANRMSSQAQQTAMHLLYYVDSTCHVQEKLNAVSTLLKQAAYESSFPVELIAKLYRKRADIYDSLNKGQEAVEDLERALKLYPNTRDGVMLASLGERQKATEAFQRILDLIGTTSSEERSQRGWTYFFWWKYQEALVEFTQAIELNPDNADAYKGRGWTYSNLGESQRAIEDFKYALRLDSNLPFVRNGIGLAFLSLKEYKKAIEAFNDSLRHDPGIADHLYTSLGDAYLSLREYHEALTNYSYEIERKLGNRYTLYAYRQRGFVYLWLRDIEQAHADFTQSYEIVSASSPSESKLRSAWMTQWIELCRKGVSSNVLERLEEMAKDGSHQYFSSLCQGVAHLLQGSFEEALKELEQAISLDQSRGDARFWQGMAYAFLKQDEKAIAAVEKSLELELPPILLAPLRWFEQERPDFYEKYVVPLLAKHA